MPDIEENRWLDSKVHLAILYETSSFCLKNLLGEQDSLKRFIFCTIEKINKCLLSIQHLYPLLEESEDIEFSIGIILRSLLMDSVLIQYLRFLTLKYDETNYVAVKAEIMDATLRFIADGTSYIIEAVYAYEKISNDEKRKTAQNLANQFPGVFDIDSRSGRPKIKEEYRVNISRIFKDSSNERLLSRERVYDLYTFYSKYDHVSHWTSIVSNINFSRRRDQISLGIVTIGVNLMDLLKVGLFHDELRTWVQPVIDKMNHDMDLASTK